MTQVIKTDPVKIWSILISGPYKILGPWVSNNKYRKDRICRYHYSHYLNKSNDLDEHIPSHFLSVDKSTPLNQMEPKEYDHYVWGGIDDEAFEEAKNAFEVTKSLWKEWEYMFRLPETRYNGEKGYASSKREAIKKAEELVISKGYSLIN